MNITFVLSYTHLSSEFLKAGLVCNDVIPHSDKRTKCAACDAESSIHAALAAYAIQPLKISAIKLLAEI
jgi:ubiquitin C-terminal hydrolase